MTRPVALFLVTLCLLATQSACLSSLSEDRPHDSVAQPLPTEIPDVISTSKPITRIAFGSCNKHDKPQPLWDAITSYKPDLWVWLGDVVYADTRWAMFDWRPSPLDVMRSKFEAQKKIPGYAKLLSTTPTIGIWDDHDYGHNNAGNEYADRVESQKMFLDFLNEPLDSPRRSLNGIYASYTFGPPGRRVKVFLLDVRYHRDNVYMGATTGDVLGPAQWAWLEHELRTSDADINIIGSGIQVLPVDKILIEKWASFPHSRRRLFKLIRDSNARGVVLLSGDIHYAEMLKINMCKDDPTGPQKAFPVYEITSSGMTHAVDYDAPFGIGHYILNLFFRSASHLTETGGYNGFYGGLNYGTLDIHWDASPPFIRAQVRGVNNSIELSQKIFFSSLQDLDQTGCNADLQDVESHWSNVYLVPFEVYQTIWFAAKFMLQLLSAMASVYLCYRTARRCFKRKSSAKRD